MMDYEALEKALENLEKIEKQISQTTLLFSKAYETTWNKIQKVQSSFQQQWDICSKWANSVTKTYEAVSSLLESPAIDTYFDQLNQMSKYFSFYTDTTWSQISRMFEFYQSPALRSQMERVASLVQQFDSTIIDVAKNYDLLDIELGPDDTITHDGIEFACEQLTSELDRQIKVAKDNKHSLREKFESLKNKLWLLLLIIDMLMLLPDLPEKIEYYSGLISQVEEVVLEKNKICFTIKERVYLREEPNSSAKIILTLSYDTPLEIIDTIPRWYQVKYFNERGQETVGWISKISVETE